MGGLLYLVVSCILVASCNAVDSLRFITVGDFGGIDAEPYSTDVERATATAMGKIADIYKPAFIFELGDNFYYSGVTDVNDKRFKETFESVYTAPSLQVPWYIIAGNHDHNGNVSAQIEYSKISKRWNFPNYYYYMEKSITADKKIGFLMIDTVQLCGNVLDGVIEQPSGPANLKHSHIQWKFIENTLNGSKADYLFVAGHFPIYSIAEHGPTKCLVKHLLPKMDKYGVNGYLCGHDHTLQHLLTKSSSGRNIDYFVSGMTNFIDPSKEHEAFVPKGSSRFYYADPDSKGGFLYTEVTSSNMTFTFLNSLGERLYTTQVFPRKK